MLTGGLVLTITLAAVEALAVITILPLVKNDLGGLHLYGWVTSAFFLTTLVGIVIGGRQADLRGPAPVYLVALVLFASGLIIGGAASSMLIVVLGRGVQGLGAGAIPAIAYASIGRAYPERLRPRMFSLLSTAWVVPGVVGPSLSAAVAVHFGWRIVFLGIVPLVIIAGGLTVPVLRRLGPPTRLHGEPHQVSDAVRVAIGATLILVALQSRNAISTPVLLALGLGLTAVPLRRLLPRGTLRAWPGLPATVLTRGLLTFAFFGADTYVPLTITSVRGSTAGFAGLAVTAATVCWTGGTWIQEWLTFRWTARRLVSAGLWIVVIGVLSIVAGLSSAVPLWELIVAWGIGGLGIGLAYSRLSVLLLSQAPSGGEGRASASLQLADNLGIIFGAGLGGVDVAVGTAAGWPLSRALAVAFVTAALIGVVGALAALRLPDETIGKR